MQPYPPEVEAIMRSFYQSLNEKIVGGMPELRP